MHPTALRRSPASRRRSWLATVCLLVGACSPLGSMAHGDAQLLHQPNARFMQECAACHVPYPPALLPSASWQRILSRLGKHYGVDASLDDATLKEISGWMLANAGTYRRAREEPPQDRITQATWFVREHRGVVAAWQRPAVGGPANCAACHQEAGSGNFDEHKIRVPAENKP